MRKTIIKIILILLIILLSIVAYYISSNIKKGTIETFYNINYRDIKSVVCNDVYNNTDEFIGIYWYKVFEKTKYDKTSHPKKYCKCYNSDYDLILNFIEFDNNTYYFSNKNINIDEIEYTYKITK